MKTPGNISALRCSLIAKEIITKMGNNVKADIAFVNLGTVQIEGLMSEEGEFGVAVPQLCSLFQFDKNQASRTFKSILGNDFQFLKWRTTLNPKAVNVILLPDVERLVFELALRQNEEAIDLSRCLIGLSLQQLFSDAFDIHFEKEERQKWLKIRQAGKVVRRTLTDAIKDYLDTHNCCPSYKQFIYANVTDEIYDGVFNRKAKTLKQQWECDNPRDVMSEAELSEVKQVEQLTMRIIDQDGIEPVRAAKEALERLIIPVINR
jgi:hypothetical protein